MGGLSEAVLKSMESSLMKSFKVLGEDSVGEVRMRMLWRRTWPVKLRSEAVSPTTSFLPVDSEQAVQLTVQS